MSLLSVIAPRLSRRRMMLKMMRDFAYRPPSILGRLSSINFHNAEVARALRIHCNVCGADAGVEYDYPDVNLRRAHSIGVLRETLACRSCGATMRDRQMAAGLLRVIAERLGRRDPDLKSFRARPAGQLQVLDTDSFSAINRTLRGLPGYAHSQFKPELRGGDVLPDGSLNVNLTDMPFNDGSFDLIMTSDVMEHVEDDVSAHREIARCLKPGGTYIFTIPYDPCLAATRPLTVPAAPGAPGGRFILGRHVHGDPHSNSGIIAHRIYGQQLFGDLATLGFKTTYEVLDVPSDGLFGGDLFLARKEA